MMKNGDPAMTRDTGTGIRAGEDLYGQKDK